MHTPCIQVAGDREGDESIAPEAVHLSGSQAVPPLKALEQGVEAWTLSCPRLLLFHDVRLSDTRCLQRVTCQFAQNCTLGGVGEQALSMFSSGEAGHESALSVQLVRTYPEVDVSPPPCPPMRS